MKFHNCYHATPYIIGFVLGKSVQEERQEKMPVTEMVARHLYVNQTKAIGMLLVWLLGELVVRNMLHQEYMLMSTNTKISLPTLHIEEGLNQENQLM